jgi:hypothetical protein
MLGKINNSIKGSFNQNIFRFNIRSLTVPPNIADIVPKNKAKIKLFPDSMYIIAPSAANIHVEIKDSMYIILIY